MKEAELGRMNIFLLLCISGPALVVGFAAILIQSGLQSSQTSRWWFSVVGLMLLILVCCGLIGLAERGWAQAAIAVFMGIFAAIIAFIASLWMASTLVGWRKTAALLLGIVFPLALLESFYIGASRWSDAAMRNGNTIVQALQSYYEDAGTYPPTLAELTPKYLTSLPEEPSSWTWFYCETDNDFTLKYVEPNSTLGWLYCATDNSFSLGYVYWIDKLGYGVYVYTSKTFKWKALQQTLLSASIGPFIIGPTRSPDDRANTPPPLRWSTLTP